MFFPNTCEVMAGFIGGRNANMSSSSNNSFVHEAFKSNFTSSGTNKKDETVPGFSGTSNSCQLLNCPECSKPCSSYALNNSQVRQVPDSNCFNCNVCYARFTALRDLEAHAATKVSYYCCMCHAGFHCRERYESHIAEHKTSPLSQQNNNLQQLSGSCDRNQKNTHNFAVDKLASNSNFLPSISNSTSSTTNQLAAFTDITKSQHGSFYNVSNALQSTNYLDQNQSMKESGSDSLIYQNNRWQNKGENFMDGSNNNCQKSNNNNNNNNAGSIEGVNNNCEFMQSGMQGGDNKLSNPLKEGATPNDGDKLGDTNLSLVQFADHMQQNQLLCTLCGKSFKSKVTLSKHARSVHKVEGGAGADFLDFLSSSMTAAGLQQTSSPNSAVPGLDKINLLESSSLGDAVLSVVSREQVSTLVGEVTGDERKTASAGQVEGDGLIKKRRNQFRSGLDISMLPRYRTSRVRYVCDVCDKEFIDKMKHRVHVRTHTGEKPYACEICNKRFNTRSQVNRHHLHIHELEGKPRSRQFRNQLTGGGRKKTQTGDQTNIPNNTNNGGSVEHGTISNNNTLNTSDEVHHSDLTNNNTINNTSGDSDPLANSIIYCSKTGQPVEMNDSSNSSHRRRRGLHRIYFCPVCGKPFRDKVKHAVHLRTHTGEKPHSCVICDKRFNTRSQVNRHMTVHKSVFQSQLDAHYLDENGSVVGGIKSEEVGHESIGRELDHQQKQINEGQGDDHNNNATNNNNVGSNNNNSSGVVIANSSLTQMTSTPKTTVRKKRTRDWEQSHMCNLCGQNFATPSGLSSHTRNRHKDQLIFNHHLLESNAANGSNNGEPIRTSDGSRVCPVCGKAFRAANSLRMHMVRHSTVKPHKCPICEKCFITKFESNRCQRRHNKPPKVVDQIIDDCQQQQIINKPALNNNNNNNNTTNNNNSNNTNNNNINNNNNNNNNNNVITHLGNNNNNNNNNNNTPNNQNNNNNLIQVNIVAAAVENLAASRTAASYQKADDIQSNQQQQQQQQQQQETVNLSIATNFIDSAANNNLPVNLSSQESWLQQSYSANTMQQLQQQQQHFISQSTASQPYQQQQNLLHQYQLLQQPHSFIHDTMLQTLTHDMLIQQQQQHNYQQQQQQQQYHDSPNSSKRRRKIV